MKLGIIIETKKPEKAWNAFRFATTGLTSEFGSIGVQYLETVD